MNLTNRQIFLQQLAQTSTAPMMLEIEKAEGIYLFDSNGKKYFDLISGISVSNIGHCHPKVINAIEEQLKKYMHLMVYGEYIQSPQVEYAKLLTDQLPNNLNCVYFTNSGSEATEGAIKLAKRMTERTEIVSFKNSYHGSTQGALSIMGDEYFRNAFRPLIPGSRLLDFNNEEHLEQITSATAAVVVEPVQAEAGVILPKENFLRKLRDRCNEVGALLIFDECQTAFGRTGTMFCFQQYQIEPDVLLLAKALGGGMPLGAFISSSKNLKALTQNPVLGHITTFGGHPVSCVAGKAALEVLINEKLIEGVEMKAELFKKYLSHPLIKDFRNSGLLISVEFENEMICKKIISNCIENGIVTDWFLFAGNCMRIAPPLIITKEEIQESCKTILMAIDKI
ncbi:MAG: aspartate aminotransferase family protein [Chitinophagales bacterium]|nr:aspartate aminotransferase family protein [Chitinophagales bacterium]